MDARTPDGGHAFPNDDDYSEMKLRDWFAGQALAGNCGFYLGEGSITADQLVKEAYAIADAMLKARAG